MTRGTSVASHDGFTLIELVVSMTVMAIGIVGVVGVVQSSMGVVVKTNQRARCMNFATQVVEAYRAIPYPLLVPSNTTSTTQLTGKGPTCTATSGLTWASDGANAQAYKQATVNVTWVDRAGAHDVRQTTLIYNGDPSTASGTTSGGGSSGGGGSGGSSGGSSGGGSTSGGSGGDPCVAPSPYSNLIANTPLNIAGTTGIDLNWTPPVSTPVPVAYTTVQGSVDNFSSYFTVTNAMSATVNSLRVNGLSSGTAYQFRIQGLSLCGATSTWSPIATATTETTASILCIPGAATVSPTGSGRTNNGPHAVLSTTPIVSINTSGVCSTFTFKYSPRSGVQRTGTLATKVGGLYSGAIATATSEAWDVGQHVIDIYDSVPIKRASVVLTVCEKNVVSCG